MYDSDRDISSHVYMQASVKGILHLAEFPLYARRFLSDIVASLEYFKSAKSKIIRMLIKMLKKHFLNFDRIKLLCFKKILLCTLSRSRVVQTRHYRSSLLQMFFKIDVLKNFANFTGKHQCWNLLLIKT